MAGADGADRRNLQITYIFLNFATGNHNIHAQTRFNTIDNFHPDDVRRSGDRTRQVHVVMLC